MDSSALFSSAVAGYAVTLCLLFAVYPTQRLGEHLQQQRGGDGETLFAKKLLRGHFERQFLFVAASDGFNKVGKMNLAMVENKASGKFAFSAMHLQGGIGNLILKRGRGDVGLLH